MPRKQMRSVALESDSPPKSSNCKMKIYCFSNAPYLCLFAKNDIEEGKELRYDYSDEENMWWRMNVSILAECLLVIPLTHS